MNRSDADKDHGGVSISSLGLCLASLIAVVLLYVLGMPWVSYLVFRFFGFKSSVSKFVMVIAQPWVLLQGIPFLTEPMRLYAEFCMDTVQPGGFVFE